jgi:hypothetical protein
MILDLMLLQFRIVLVRENSLVTTSAIVGLDRLWHHQMKRSSSLSVSHNLRVGLVKSVCASIPVRDMDLSDIEKQQNDHQDGVLATKMPILRKNTDVLMYTLGKSRYIFVVCSLSIE